MGGASEAARVALDARCPCFYGWVIVAILVVVQCASHIGSVLLNAITISYMMDEYELAGVSRPTFSLMWMLGTLCAGVGTFFAGRLIDRHGARVCMPAVMLVEAAFVLLMVHTGPGEALPWQLLPVSFFGIRLCSLGAVNPWINAVIGQWFFKRRGKAVAIKGFGNEIGVNLLLAPIFQALLDANGWRSANTIFAGLCVVVSLPAGLFLHHTPESVGCLPDGDHRIRSTAAYSPVAGADDTDETETTQKKGPEAQRGSYTRAQAFRTLPIYLLAFDMFFAATIGAGTAQVMRPALLESGATRETPCLLYFSARCCVLVLSDEYTSTKAPSLPAVPCSAAVPRFLTGMVYVQA